MARASKQAQMLKQKEAKQKKLLYVLIPLFLALAAFQGPKTYKSLFASPAPPPAPIPTTPTQTTTGPTATTPANENGLPDTDIPAEGGVDRLVGFSRFTGRDPFGPPGGTSGSSESSSEQVSSAVIQVNGTAETVTVGGNFPSSDPTFRLVSLADGKAVVGLVTGSFDSGEDAVELTLGEELELVADPDGTHYQVKLVSIG